MVVITFSSQIFVGNFRFNILLSRQMGINIKHLLLLWVTEWFNADLLNAHGVLNNLIKKLTNVFYSRTPDVLY